MQTFYMLFQVPLASEFFETKVAFNLFVYTAFVVLVPEKLGLSRQLQGDKSATVRKGKHWGIPDTKSLIIWIFFKKFFW
jgi:hypothetical protein